ncbi:MAG: aminoglycoside phosphotransferase family protein [Lentisphaeria bacterium]|nr:aminoglycoside phosphotransferase family protein [Lentisphaeria bacterium]
MEKTELQQIFDLYTGNHTVLSFCNYGGGHINDTIRVFARSAGQEKGYILQRINTNVFKNPELLMDNFKRVTEHLHQKYAASPELRRHRTLDLLPTLDGKPFAVVNGNYYRVYEYVSGACSSDIMATAENAFQVARAFGNFQKDLVDLPGERLQETIPNFHNTPSRLANLEKAIREDRCGRLKNVMPEVDFVMARRDETSRLLDLCAQGAYPERITHNDTKLNNILFDDVTGEEVAVIDLDTVMPGLVHYDFGDMVRTGTSPAAEDEKDLSKVYMRMDFFEGLLKGYLSSAGEFLTPVEKEELPFSGKLITLEIGMRFLTDYLEGDTYFKVHREGHNLDRCRTQFKLVQSIEEQFDAMRKLLNA